MDLTTLAALDRCDRELERIRAEVANGTKQPSWLIALGELDWQVEKRLIKAEAGKDRPVSRPPRARKLRPWKEGEPRFFTNRLFARVPLKDSLRELETGKQGLDT